MRINFDKFKSIFKSVGLVMVATIFVRSLGFLREMVVASKYGTSIYSDAFISAFSFPDLLANGFGAAISTLYVPLYIKTMKDSEKESKNFNNLTSLILLSVSIIIVTVFSIFPDFFVNLLVSGFDNETMEITISLSRVMIFSSIPVLISQHYKAYCQVKKKYYVALFFECIINLFIIAGLILISIDVFQILAYIVVVANLLYALIMFIYSFKNGFRYNGNTNFKNTYFKELLLGVAPVLIANLILEINQIIDKNFASSLEIGTVSALNYSSKIINLIIAILGTTIAVVYFPSLSKSALDEDKTNFINQVYHINSFIFIFSIPIVIFVILFSNDIISCLFGRGEFNEDSTFITANCLLFYSLTIIGGNLKAIWIRIFNAELNTLVPAIISVVSVFINVGLNFLLINLMKERGLALATSVTSLLTALIYIVVFKLKHLNFKIIEYSIDILKILLFSSIFLLMVPFTFILNFNCWLNLIIEAFVFTYFVARN